MIPKGTLFIHTVNAKYLEAFRDPTHKHFFTIDSFDYFDPETEPGKRFHFYTRANFEIIKKAEEKRNLAFVLIKRKNENRTYRKGRQWRTGG